MKTAIEAVFRRQRIVVPASVRVEVRVWATEDGVVERIQLLRATGDAKVDAAIQSVVGTQISDRPPADTPWPVILRLSFLRPG
jgi:outer membrane biosynthesis protein TonB